MEKSDLERAAERVYREWVRWWPTQPKPQHLASSDLAGAMQRLGYILGIEPSPPVGVTVDEHQRGVTWPQHQEPMNRLNRAIGDIHAVALGHPDDDPSSSRGVWQWNQWWRR